MAIAYVNRAECTVSSSATSTASTASVSHTAGNLLVAFTNFQTFFGASSITVADTAGNTWHAVGTTQAQGNNRLQIWYAYNCAGHASNVVTITLNAFTSGYMTVSVRQFSGVMTTDPIDGYADDSGSGTSLSSGSVTVTASEAVIVAGAEADGQSFTGGSGYTLTTFGGADGSYFADEYKIVTASEAATMTAGSGAWGITAAAFKVATGGGGKPWHYYAQQCRRLGEWFRLQSMAQGAHLLGAGNA